MLRLNHTLSSSQQTEDTHRKFSVRYAMHSRVIQALDTLRKATTAWLFRVLLVLTIVGAITLLVLDVVKDVAFAVWYIEFLLIALLVFMLIITLINGKWNENTQSMEVEPVINLLMIGLLMLVVAAYICDVILHEDSVRPYLEALGVAVIVLVATSLIAWMDRKMKY